MNANVLIKEISFWSEEIQKLEGKISVIYEIAIFKIFVKLEVFLSDLFVYYSIGNPTESGYMPKRKLKFEDEKHFMGVFKNSKSSYIDYLDKIENTSKHIFENEKNPFDLIFLEPRYLTYYKEMKVIRNYVAHESNESKDKYIKTVLNNKEYIPPYEYLSKINKKKGKTNYSIYIEVINNIVNILLDPADFLGDSVEVTI